MAEQSDGLLCGIIWSDGIYYANLIEDRVSNQPVSVDDDGSRVTDLVLDRDEVLEELTTNLGYQVRGTIVIEAFDEASPLGTILS